MIIGKQRCYARVAKGVGVGKAKAIHEVIVWLPAPDRAGGDFQEFGQAHIAPVIIAIQVQVHLDCEKSFVLLREKEIKVINNQVF